MKLTYRRIFLLSFLHASNRCTAVAFSEIRSVSRLMLWREFIRLVAAIEASATATFIELFSASRLNGLDFFLCLSLSFFLSFDEPKKEDPDLEDDFVWLKDWTVCVG